MAVTYYNKLFCTGTIRQNGILFVLLLVAETMIKTRIIAVKSIENKEIIMAITMIIIITIVIMTIIRIKAIIMRIKIGNRIET